MMFLFLVSLAALIRHDGVVITQGASEAPLLAASISAYAREQPVPAGSCGHAGGELAHRSTNRSGLFALEIDAGIGRYFVLYCADGYAARGEWNRNERGRRAAPEPVRLWPARAAGPEAADAAQRALSNVLDDAATTLHRIAAMDATAHLVAKEGARPEDIQVIELLDARIAKQSVWVAKPDRASPEAVVDVLANAASHARYFWRVAPVAFNAAAQRLTADEQAAVLWLRNRPRGARD